MKQLSVSATDAGQRFDKYLMRLLPGAGKSFLYKMLRKKNIVLNGAKAEGNELLNAGDEVKVFFSDDTFEKFSENGSDDSRTVPRNNSHNGSNRISQINSGAVNLLERMPGIVFENEHILAIDKPAGLLSQKAEESDVSAVEYVAAYLKNNGIEKGLKPSVSNRLDRNTSGLLLAGKTGFGQRELAKMLRDRTVEKYYLCIVKGEVKEPGREESFLTKDEITNKVSIDKSMGAERIVTAYRPISATSTGTLLEVELITGKSHQIRAQMAAIGHPIAGDSKYGDREYNALMRERFGIKRQMLHAYRMVFPILSGPLEDISGKEIKTCLPAEIEHFCRAYGVKI